MTWTQAQLDAYNARRSTAGNASPSLDAAAPGEEAKLHTAILEECKRNGWQAFHGSTAHRTYRTIGEPDFIIAADSGRTFFLECKTRTGKLTTEQLATLHVLNRLGHKAAVVRSIREFNEFTNL